MTVSLSYDSFPHVWGVILAESSWEAKLVLRAVCKGLRDVVDRLLVQHLVLEKGKSSSPEAVDVFSLKHRIPRCRALCPKSWAGKPRRKRLLSDLMWGVKVIDIRGHITSGIDVSRLAPLFPNLQVLRLTTGTVPPDTYTPYIHFEAEKLVLFMKSDVRHKRWWFQVEKNALLPPHQRANAGHSQVGGSNTSSAARTGHRPDDDFPLQKHGFFPETDFAFLMGLLQKRNWEQMNPQPSPPLEAIAPSVPATYRKIVLNMNGTGAPLDQMYPFLLSLPSHIEEVVVVVPRYRSVTQEGAVRSDTPFPMYIHALLETLGENNAHVTIVGLEKCGDRSVRELRQLFFEGVKRIPHYDVDYTIDDEMTLRMAPQTRQFTIRQSESWRREMAEIERERGEPPQKRRILSLKEKVDEIMGRVELLTMPEYIERVGLETAALEVQEY